MGVISGIVGAVSGVSGNTVRQWTIREIQRGAPWVASKWVDPQAGGVSRACGVKDWRGHFLGYGHTPVVFPGQTFVFTGSTGGPSPKGVTGPAICDRIAITWDIESGGIIEHRVDFSGNGTLDKSDTTSITDSVTPVIACSTSMKVAIDGADETNIRSMRLIISAANRPYVSSDTAGQVNRTPGNIDAACTYRLYQDDPGNLPTLATPSQLRFYVTATTYWQMTWMNLEEIDDYQVNLEKPENVGAAIKGAFCAYTGSNSGTILSPSTTQKWPTYNAEP